MSASTRAAPRLDDGAVRARVRLQLADHAAAQCPMRRGRGRAAAQRGTPDARAPRGAGGGGRARRLAGQRGHGSLHQPGLAPASAPHRLGVGAGPGARVRTHARSPPEWRVRRAGLQHQDARGLPDRAGARPSLPDRRARAVAPARRAPVRRRRSHGRGQHSLVRDDDADPRRASALCRRFDEQLLVSADLRIKRPVAGHRWPPIWLPWRQRPRYRQPARRDQRQRRGVGTVRARQRRRRRRCPRRGRRKARWVRSARRRRVRGRRDGGATGSLRLLDSEIGGQIGWTLPLALVGVLAGLWLVRRAPRTDRRRARSIGSERMAGAGRDWQPQASARRPGSAS